MFNMSLLGVKVCKRVCILTWVLKDLPPPPFPIPPMGYSFEFLVGYACSILQPLSLFQTKICNFPVLFFRPSLYNLYSLPFSDLVSLIHTRLCKIHSRFQTFRSKWSQSIPMHFQTKTAQKPCSLGPHIPSYP